MKRRTQGVKDKATIERSAHRRVVPHAVLQKPGKRPRTGYRIGRHRRPRIAHHITVRAEALGLQVARGTPALLKTAWLCRWICWPKGQDWRTKAVGGVTPTEALKMYHWRMIALLGIEETLAAAKCELDGGAPDLIDATHEWVGSQGSSGQMQLPVSLQHLSWDTALHPVRHNIERRKQPMADETFGRMAAIYVAGERVDRKFYDHLGFLPRLQQLLAETQARRISAGGQATSQLRTRRRL